MGSLEAFDFVTPDSCYIFVIFFYIVTFEKQETLNCIHVFFEDV